MALLAEMRGVVLSADENRVRVKLGEGTVVQFPREVVDDDLIQVGMSIVYQVHTRPDGTRFQQFLRGEPTGTKADMEELEALLTLPT